MMPLVVQATICVNIPVIFMVFVNLAVMDFLFLIFILCEHF